MRIGLVIGQRIKVTHQLNPGRVFSENVNDHWWRTISSILRQNNESILITERLTHCSGFFANPPGARTSDQGRL